jgi:hypothetical protein
VWVKRHDVGGRRPYVSAHVGWNLAILLQTKFEIVWCGRSATTLVAVGHFK